MKIEIELSEEDAACLWADYGENYSVASIIRDMALDKAAKFKRVFPEDASNAVTAFRESQAKKGAQA